MLLLQLTVLLLAGPALLASAMRDSEPPVRTLESSLPRRHQPHHPAAAPSAAVPAVPAASAEGRAQGAPLNEAAEKPEPMEVAFGKSSLVLQRKAGNPPEQTKEAPAPSPAQTSPTGPTATSADTSTGTSEPTSVSTAASSQNAGAAQSNPDSTAGSNTGAAASRVDLFVSETAKTHHALAQLLGIEGGGLCPDSPVSGSQSGPKHGCRLGCRCGVLQRCYSKPYDGPGIHGANGEEVVDIGVCRLAFPALMAIFAAISLTVWMGAIMLRKADPNRSDTSGSWRPQLSRTELESRLKSATALNDEQRKAILDTFCGKRKDEKTPERLDSLPKSTLIPLKASQVAVTS